MKKKMKNYITKEEQKELRELYSREWNEIEDTRAEYKKLNRYIDLYKELLGYYIKSSDITTFTEREKQLNRLKVNIVRLASELKISDRQIDYIISLEEQLNRTIENKRKFSETVKKAVKLRINSKRMNIGYEDEGGQPLDCNII